jgi:hypothetical protein
VCIKQVTMTTIKVKNIDVIPQQNGDPTVKPDGTEVALGQLNIEDNDITMVNAEMCSDEDIHTPRREQIFLKTLQFQL